VNDGCDSRRQTYSCLVNGEKLAESVGADPEVDPRWRRVQEELERIGGVGSPALQLAWESVSMVRCVCRLSMTSGLEVSKKRGRRRRSNKAVRGRVL
jgi:hypothetical protein